MNRLVECSKSLSNEPNRSTLCHRFWVVSEIHRVNVASKLKVLCNLQCERLSV